MEQPPDDLVPTRATLLDRLKDWKDNASWQVFFDTYWRLIYSFALKNNLTPAEAEEVVQETLIEVARQMPDFKYKPELGSFRSWLLTLTNWRVSDQRRKRRKADRLVAEAWQVDAAEPAPAKTLEDAWNADWEKNIFQAAMDNVRRRMDPAKYQIFDFVVNKEWPPEKVAKAFRINIENVYSIKHRLCEMVKEEAKRLEKEMT